MDPTSKPSKRYQLFERRRGFPRLIMEIPAKVTGHDGNNIDAILFDLSPDGAQIRYPVAEGKNLFSGRDSTSGKNSRKLNCLLQFRLESPGEQHTVKIHARSVYLRPVDKKMLANGLFFDQDDHDEKKKIRDYLYIQLEESFAELEKEHLQKSRIAPEAVKKPLPETNRQDKAEEERNKKNTASKPAENLQETTSARSDMEYLKQEMVRIQSSLKVIQETTRHIDEKLALLEQKITRGH